MYKIGMYGGAFNPLHLGHVNDIIEASNQCEKLYVALSISNSKEEIDHRERLMWLKTITKDMENIEIFEIYDKNSTKEEYDWESGATDIKQKINKKIDVVFSGDDYKNKNIWEKLYPESKIIYIPRNQINISSTKIRQNPYKYYEYMPKIVQKHYIKKVCIIGTESCGKSTLTRNLAKVFNTSYAKEAGRYICDEAGGIDNMQKKHYFEILFKQKQIDKEKLDQANKIFFIDTDSLITEYYYTLTFAMKTKEDKAFKNIANSISLLNKYDLYLFLEPDVRWVQDGTRTYGDEKVRQKNNEILKQILKENNINYKIIKGNYEERYKEAVKLCKELIGD